VKKEKSSPRKSPRKSPKKKSDKAEKAEPKKKGKKRAASQEKEKPSKRAKRTKKSSDTDSTPKKPKPRGRPRKGSTDTAGTASDTSSGAASSELVWVWQFLENDSLYYNYEPEASDVVEEVYQSYVKSPGATDVRSVKSGQWNYMIDFREMTQQNIQHENHKKRKIRRIQIPASDKSNTDKSYN